VTTESDNFTSLQPEFRRSRTQEDDALLVSPILARSRLSLESACSAICPYGGVIPCIRTHSTPYSLSSCDALASDLTLKSPCLIRDSADYNLRYVLEHAAEGIRDFEAQSYRSCRFNSYPGLLSRSLSTPYSAKTVTRYFSPKT